MALSPTVKLSSGYDCPVLGYGTFMATDSAQLQTGLKEAIQAGYRHIDTAHIYRNEEVIGDTLQKMYSAGTVNRKDVFITTKLFPTHFRPDLVEPMLRKQLLKLKVAYIDLYLLHLPLSMKPPNEGDYTTSVTEVELDFENKLEDTWAALEKCVMAGLVRSIGVSNFTIAHLDRILKSATIQPAMNQVELHPFFQNKKLTDYCTEKNIVVTAYSQFGRPGVISPMTGKPFFEGNLLEDERLVKLAKKYNKSPAQVILRWLFQRNIVAIPKSVTPSRIVENFNIWDFQLAEGDIEVIASMDTNKRCNYFILPGCDKHPDYTFTPESC